MIKKNKKVEHTRESTCVFFLGVPAGFAAVASEASTGEPAGFAGCALHYGSNLESRFCANHCLRS